MGKYLVDGPLARSGGCLQPGFRSPGHQLTELAGGGAQYCEDLIDRHQLACHEMIFALLSVPVHRVRDWYIARILRYGGQVQLVIGDPRLPRPAEPARHSGGHPGSKTRTCKITHSPRWPLSHKPLSCAKASV